MQETIKNSGLTISQFAEHYGIPYNTVYQWANGERKAPKWVKTFIERIQKIETKGEQLKIKVENKHLAGIAKGEGTKEIKRFFENEQKRDIWKESYIKAGCKVELIDLIEINRR